MDDEEVPKELGDLQTEFGRALAKQVNIGVGHNVARLRKERNLKQTEFGAQIAKEIVQWRELAKTTKITVD